MLTGAVRDVNTDPKYSSRASFHLIVRGVRLIAHRAARSTAIASICQFSKSLGWTIAVLVICWCSLQFKTRQPLSGVATSGMTLMTDTVDNGDTLSLEGAQQLARAVEAYWHSRGHTTVRTSVHEISLRGESSKSGTVGRVHVVRSNLVRGRPPRAPNKSHHGLQ